METTRISLAAPMAAIFSLLLFSGCYTQFYVADSDSDDAADTDPVYIDQPVLLPTNGPGPILIGVPYYPELPIAGSGGNTPGKTATPPKRDSGKQRVPPTVTAPSTPPSRGGGTTTPAPAPAPATVAPAPAPAAPAPARAPESRPSGGSGTRR